MDFNKQQQKLVRFLSELREFADVPLGGTVPLTHRRSEAAAMEMLQDAHEQWDAVPDDFVWGGADSHHWFAGRFVMPVLGENEQLILKVAAPNRPMMGRTHSQCQVWINGRLHQGVDGYHTEITPAAETPAGTELQIVVNAYTATDDRQLGFAIEPCIRNRQIVALCYDLSVPFEVARRLPETDRRRREICNRIEDALGALDFRDRSGLLATLVDARPHAEAIYAITDTEAQPKVSCVGHTHIDVAWLWPVAQTREKMMRSMSTALQLLDDNPDFVFMYNQCVLFDYLKSDAPELYRRIKDHVAGGRFEIEGAMWLEPDVNIASGESLIRHIQFGRRFHQEEFGITPRVLWLPDTFGYSAALPQIMAKSGIEFLVTSKLSWNDTNRMPADTFVWEGIDGSAVNTYLITTQRNEDEHIRTDYGPDLDVSYVFGAWRRYEPKSVNDEILVPYGHGDGGGGVTQEMIEKVRRLERGIAGAPKVRMEGIAPFLDRLGARIAAAPQAFPRWVGELYLEYHRGTLTSIGKNKLNNRRAEDRMSELEFVSALGVVLDRSLGIGAETLDKFWRCVLLNQFHDILPGTSIARVYEDSDRDYAAFFADTAETLRRAVAGLVSQATRYAVVHPGAQSRQPTLVLLPADAQVSPTEPVRTQRLVRADGSSELALMATIPALSVTACDESRAIAPAGMLEVSDDRLENDLIRVSFDGNGEIVSVFDKRAEREVLKPGTRANRLVAYEDKPVFWDSWDVDWYFDQKSWPVEEAASISVVERGPLRVAIRIERRYRQSRIVQVASLAAGAALVEFDSFVDWRERQTLLKAGFDFDLNANSVEAEIQFGHVTRPTHFNTSWDRARFEASMHRWVAMREGDYAVGLVNDCKYGYDAKGQAIRLTLIKSGTYPFDGADQEEHRFRYGLTVASVDCLSVIANRAAEFSAPLHAIDLAASPETGVDAGDMETLPAAGLVSVNAPNVAISAIKPAEDGRGVIIRLFEQANRRARIRLDFGFEIGAAFTCSMIEDGEVEIDPDGSRGLALEVRPFEIITLRVIPA